MSTLADYIYELIKQVIADTKSGKLDEDSEDEVTAIVDSYITTIERKLIE